MTITEPAMPPIHLQDYAVSPNVAAAILGYSDKHVRKLLKDGALPGLGKGHRRIPLSAIGEFRGSPITTKEFMDASVQVIRQRDYWRAYQAARRREAQSGVTE